MGSPMVSILVLFIMLTATNWTPTYSAKVPVYEPKDPTTHGAPIGGHYTQEKVGDVPKGVETPRCQDCPAWKPEPDLVQTDNSLLLIPILAIIAFLGYLVNRAYRWRCQDLEDDEMIEDTFKNTPYWSLVGQSEFPEYAYGSTSSPYNSPHFLRSSFQTSSGFTSMSSALSTENIRFPSDYTDTVQSNSDTFSTYMTLPANFQGFQQNKQSSSRVSFNERVSVQEFFRHESKDHCHRIQPKRTTNANGERNDAAEPSGMNDVHASLPLTLLSREDHPFNRMDINHIRDIVNHKTEHKLSPLILPPKTSVPQWPEVGPEPITSHPPRTPPSKRHGLLEVGMRGDGSTMTRFLAKASKALSAGARRGSLTGSVPSRLNIMTELGRLPDVLQKNQTTKTAKDSDGNYWTLPADFHGSTPDIKEDDKKVKFSDRVSVMEFFKQEPKDHVHSMKQKLFKHHEEPPPTKVASPPRRKSTPAENLTPREGDRF